MRKGGKRLAPRAKASAGSIVLNIVIAVCVIAGIGLLAYPSVADWYNRSHASKATADYVKTVDNISAQEAARMLSEAEAYNRDLFFMQDRWRPEEDDTARYESILDVTGTGIMGYVEIEKIDVKLPIYHGTSDTVLQIAAGHMEGSSFPIDGNGVHSVISGHSALPSAKLFTDLVKMAEGDMFSVTVLDKTRWYEIVSIDTVLPEEFDGLALDPDRNLCTLMTCTPYGVNSHRLLITGELRE